MAEALGIPTVWIKSNDRIDDFKYYDYYHSIKYTDVSPLMFYDDVKLNDVLKKIWDKKNYLDADKILSYFYNN
jgi:hypothetical protein